MSLSGYQKKRFPNLQGQIFDCPLCQCVAKYPMECNSCGNLFCRQCIHNFKRINHTCKFGCTGDTIHPMTARALINIYEDLDIQCEKCIKVFKLACGRSNCKFYDLCDSVQDTDIKTKYPVCSQRCEFLAKIEMTGGDQKKIYDLIVNHKPKSMGKLKISRGNLELKWRPEQCGMNVVFNNGNNALFLKQQAYVFRSVLTTEGFTQGCHYWEILADNRTQNQLKIGVSTNNLFDFNTAFCDHVFGFAFYGLAQLRHGSNATGTNFGKRFKKNGILGVYLNMNLGELHFSLNGQYLGRAFQDIALTKGVIYPAVALLHCAGCSISGQLPIPQIFKGR